MGALGGSQARCARLVAIWVGLWVLWEALRPAFRAGVVVPVSPGVFSWFTERSNACGQLRQGAPDHSCSQTTCVAARPTALGVYVLSQTLSDREFLICCGGIASIANENHDAVS